MPPSTPNPYPYITQEELELRLDGVDFVKSDIGLDGSDWSSLIDDIIAEHSAWVHRVIVENGVKPSDYNGTKELLQTWPEVRTAMVRLCRSSLHLIEQQGLESESASDRSESYRPPEKIRENVLVILESVTPDDGGGGDGGRQFRSTII